MGTKLKIFLRMAEEFFRAARIWFFFVVGLLWFVFFFFVFLGFFVTFVLCSFNAVHLEIIKFIELPVMC